MKGKLSLLASVCLVAFVGCAGNSSGPSASQVNSTGYDTLFLGANGEIVYRSTQAAKVQEAGYWRGDGVSGSPSITIDLSHQEAYFYKGGQLVGMSPISSGREGYRTPTGQFSIIQKSADHKSNLYGNYVDSSGNILVKNIGIMEDPRPPGAKFDGAPMPYFMRITGGVGMHKGFLPGVPDSHGCIRMPGNMAQVFFEHAPLGTPVRVVH